jgi:hypothetical protein
MFGEGARIVGVAGGRRVWSASAQPMPHHVAGALARSVRSTPPQMRRLLLGCARALAGDDPLPAGRLEVFRALAKALGCAFPPQLGAPRTEATPAHDTPAFAELFPAEVGAPG